MITCLTDFDLRPRNTFRIPSRARLWIEFNAADDIPAVAENCNATTGPVLIIGAGSDILFTEEEFPGSVIHSSILTLEMEQLPLGQVRITAGSGITMDELVERTCSAGLWGMENLSGIPGEVGASAVQNVGAYGCEASDLIESVYAYDILKRRFIVLYNDDCNFGYRYSVFKSPEARGRYIIASVTYILSTIPNRRLNYGNLSAMVGCSNPTPLEIRQAVIATRNAKLPDPAVTGSAGSYFTNPIVTPDQFAAVEAKARERLGADTAVPHFNLPDGRIKIPAAWLIDHAGLKGVREGGAGTWPTQPLVIANISGNCTARDVIKLEQRITDTVRDIFGIQLGLEVEKAPASLPLY
ncbi:MAG: UDP-N-acetylmuramate dehydrogenase [Bacteroides sp.]|nr:UDP-N-acetylmuramate dehydrogenase [Bacteroides sp.]